MNDTTDPIFKALDRLARVADTNPVGDPMPGIRRKARANRRRAAALAASGLAAVVAAGFVASSVVDFPRAAQDPGYANSPSAAVSVAPRPAPSTPPSRPGEPTLAEYDQARADVNGDGSADVIRILGAEADAADGQEETMASENVVNAEPDPDSLSDLIDNGGLYSQEGVASSVLADDGLISWVPIGDESARPKCGSGHGSSTGCCSSQPRRSRPSASDPVSSTPGPANPAKRLVPDVSLQGVVI